MIERDFYPLSMLAERWGCTVNDLLHLGIQDRAQVCVNIYGMASGVRRTRMETDAPEGATDDEPLTAEELSEAEAHNAAFERWLKRTTKDMPAGIYELSSEDCRLLDLPGSSGLELHSVLKFDGGWWDCEFDPPVNIKFGHLCMLHEEVQRLDREVFGVGAKARETPAVNAPMSLRAEATYLNIIGALLELVLGKTPAGKPHSVFTSQAAIIDALLAHHADKPGISKTTLEGKFAEARRRLNST
ncbi:hypothetical protein [Roseateles puraquae]|uniref:hypothetical protein n=1 Tax=Roseateles puraquae TaxID=431059 RepID=UPI0031DA6775